MGDLSIHDWDEAGHVVKNKHTKFEQDRSIEKKKIGGGQFRISLVKAICFNNYIMLS